MKPLSPLAATAALAVAALAIPANASPPPRVFDALAFFAGATEGRGTLTTMMHGAKPMAVHGRGRIDPDGTLVLAQTVEEAGKPAKDREWRIRQTSPLHYTGTLTDAVGPIAGESVGNRLHLHYGMKGGLAAEQWLTLSADGQTALNDMRVRKMGVTVARLTETIRRTVG